MAHDQQLESRDLRRGSRRFAAVFLALMGALGAVCGPPALARDILAVRHFSGPDHTRIVLDMSGPGSFEVRRVRGPDRIAINLAGADVGAVGPVAIGDGLVDRIRLNAGPRRAQVVLDLPARADFRSFSLPAAAGRADRIVVDVLRPAAAAPVAEPAPGPGPDPFVVIVDPGHGGPDPGAMRHGFAEKDIVLEVAREMVRLLNAVPGYRAHLTRTGDEGLELSERVAAARDKGGDLFLSVHCNTHVREAVDGMEVYFLSLRGATDREARELADKENAAQLVGLDPAAPCDDMVVDILLDLRMARVLEESARLSRHILAAGQAGGRVSGRRVKQAGFQVLKNMAMPSALVELAYMSNPDDLAVLGDRQGRRDLAASVVEGVLAWRRDGDGLDQLAAGGGWTRDYRVRRGDSLWGLARRHGTTVTEITRRNNLAGGTISIGQVLRLPETGRAP